MLKFSLRNQLLFLCHQEARLRRELHIKGFEMARFMRMVEPVVCADEISEYYARCSAPAFSAGTFILMRMERIVSELDELAARKEELRLRQWKTLRGRIYMGLLKLGLCRPRQLLIEMKHEE